MSYKMDMFTDRLVSIEKKCYILKRNYILLNYKRVHRADTHNTDYNTSKSHVILRHHPFQSTIHTSDGRGQFYHHDPTVPQINDSHNQQYHLNCQRQFHQSHSISHSSAHPPNHPPAYPLDIRSALPPRDSPVCPPSGPST